MTELKGLTGPRYSPWRCPLKEGQQTLLPLSSQAQSHLSGTPVPSFLGPPGGVDALDTSGLTGKSKQDNGALRAWQFIRLPVEDQSGASQHGLLGNP